METAEEEQAVEKVRQGPESPYCMEMCEAEALDIIFVTKSGLTRIASVLYSFPNISSRELAPPIPVPRYTPERRFSSSRSTRPESFHASAAAVSASWLVWSRR